MARNNKTEHWSVFGWRPTAAYVYLLICLSDFMLMPLYYEIMNHKLQTAQFVQLALQFPEGVAQIEALKAIRETRVWEPLTLKATGLFHMAFGAILGVTAWTRGQEKIQRAKTPSSETEEQ